MNTTEFEQTLEQPVVDGRRSKSQRAVSQIVISAIMLTIAIMLKGVTELIPFLNLPFGGSISLVMVPLILITLLCGPIYGTLGGVLFGLIDFFWDGVISWTPNALAIILSLLLDYIIGFGSVGLGGIFRKRFFKKQMWASIAAISLSGVVRLLSSFLSGVIVFTTAFDYASTEGLAVDFSRAGIIYSLSYNGAYMLPTIVLSIFVLAVLTKPLFSVLDIPSIKILAPKANDANQAAEKISVPTFEKLVPIYLFTVYALAVLGAIPSLFIHWFGYLSIVFGVFFVGYESYLIIHESKTEKSLKEMIFCSIYLALFLLSIGVSLAAILSPYTYGKETYESSTTSLLALPSYF